VRAGDRSGLEWTPLLEDPMWIVLPAGHRLADRTSVSLVELADERWVHGCLYVGHTIEHYAALAGIQIRTACRGTDYAFAQALVRAGVGISLIPSVALSDHSGLSVVELEPPRPSRYVGVAVARRRRPQPLVAALLDALQETVAAQTSKRPAGQVVRGVPRHRTSGSPVYAG
jgi:DNA-binding transcriptional LysR family regulator